MAKSTSKRFVLATGNGFSEVVEVERHRRAESRLVVSIYHGDTRVASVGRAWYGMSVPYTYDAVAQFIAECEETAAANPSYTFHRILLTDTGDGIIPLAMLLNR